MRHFFYKHKIKISLLLFVVVVYYFSLPKELFNDPTATVVESTEGYLLGATIAADMQWRFPERNTTPEKFKQCIVQYEDAYFYKHWGFNPVSIYKAFKTNIKAGKIVRGGSTITQQVIRLSRKNKPRTYTEKIIELLLATRLEFKYSKNKILSLYSSHAPFGGNIVGLDAASWRYFGQEVENLSWAENATLAVLPNSPGLIHINNNRATLRLKRNKLLHKLFTQRIIDSLTYSLAIQEPLPDRTFALPQIAPHLVAKIAKQHPGERIQTSIQQQLQQKLNKIVALHYKELKQNHVYNMAAIVIDIKTRKIRAYIGNSPTDKAHQKDVDVIGKPRSTGSILKPFLYASMLNDGEILPHTIIPDIPTQFSGYKPENFNLTYYGAVSASKALAKSLNIPAVRMLQTYGVDRFYTNLQTLQLHHISKGGNYYGLPLVLGGAESSLWDITRAFTSLSSTLIHYDQTQGSYYKNELVDLTYLKNKKVHFGEKTREYSLFDAGSIYSTYQALRELNRPEEEENWEFYNETTPIAWKTGTSFGFRDAWAVGTSTKYVVGVWVGNADGEGRPGLTGISAAAPILFDVFSFLPTENWFTPPYDELVQVPTCKQSGYRASNICNEIDSVWVPRSGLKTAVCPYHHWVHLDKSESYQVNSSCESITNMIHKSWFILPPVQAYYYQKRNLFYKALPPYREDCIRDTNNPMEIVDKYNYEHIFLPKNFNENKNPIIFKIKHQQPNIQIFWYLDGFFIKSTQDIHELAFFPKKGKHTLTVVDLYGNEIKKSFEIL